MSLANFLEAVEGTLEAVIGKTTVIDVLRNEKIYAYLSISSSITRYT